MEAINYHAEAERHLHKLIETIADDLKIQKHLYSLTKIDGEVAFLELGSHDKIFELVGIQKDKINDSFREWYLQLTKKAIAVDLHEDEEKLLTIAAGLLIELNSKHFE